MNPDPLAVALREITQTKNLLQSLILSSESFDYAKAKLALQALQQKIRTLEKLQKGLEVEEVLPPKNIPNICVLDFHSTQKVTRQSPNL